MMKIPQRSKDRKLAIVKIMQVPDQANLNQINFRRLPDVGSAFEGKQIRNHIIHFETSKTEEK